MHEEFDDQELRRQLDAIDNVAHFKKKAEITLEAVIRAHMYNINLGDEEVEWNTDQPSGILTIN